MAQTNPPIPPAVWVDVKTGRLTREAYKFLVELNQNANDVVTGEVETPAAGGLEGGGLVVDGVSLSIADNGVSNAMLRQSLGYSVMGRYAGSTGNVSDIVAVADNTILARLGGVLAFQPIALVPATVADGDYGDITVSGVGTVWTIDAGVVSFAKFQSIASDRLVGRDAAGSGAATEIAVGGGIEFTGTNALQTSAFTGDATKAAGGTALTLATVNANVGSFGSATQVATFTANGKGLLTAAANVSIAIPASQVTDFTEAAQDAVGAMVGASLVYADATPLLARAALTGDVTAPQDSNTTTLATVNANVGSFGSATQTGTFTVNAKGLITAAADVTITPAASSITGGAALTRVDDTNVTLTLGGTPTTALLAATSLTLGWTGTLGVARGGTNIASYAVGDLLYASGAATLAKLADVATGNALISGGVGVAPAWGKIGLTTHVSGTLAAGNGGTGVTSLGDITKADDTNVTLTLGGTPAGAVITSTSFTLGWTGTLAVTRGGLGFGTTTQGDILYADGANSLAKLAKDTNATRYLSNTGSSNNPAWALVNLTNGVTGTLPVGNGGTGITSLGTGVATALGINVGSAGAFVTFNGALGTPSSGTLTNATGLPVSTGISGLGANVATFLATPSSANLAAALTDETGSGAAVFGTTPTMSGPIMGAVPSSNWGLDFAPSTSNGNYITIGNDATYDLAAGSGVVFLWEDAGAGAGMFALMYGSTDIIWQSGTLYTLTADTASKINVYYNGAGNYRIQNKTGASVNIFVSGIRLRASS